MNRRALERGDLGASFEPYSNLVRGVVASLSLKMYSLFFYIVVCSRIVPWGEISEEKMQKIRHKFYTTL